ncbi:hypothetical protein C8R45DRAFT_942802 [Mycena sanguinolenta]|nr:hypothetical protein C8R45DRAFT_942802 [Mycena sanguinolenta]
MSILNGRNLEDPTEDELDQTLKKERDCYEFISESSLRICRALKNHFAHLCTMRNVAFLEAGSTIFEDTSKWASVDEHNGLHKAKFRTTLKQAGHGDKIQGYGPKVAWARPMRFVEKVADVKTKIAWLSQKVLVSSLDSMPAEIQSKVAAEGSPNLSTLQEPVDTGSSTKHGHGQAGAQNAEIVGKTRWLKWRKLRCKGHRDVPAGPVQCRLNPDASKDLKQAVAKGTYHAQCFNRGAQTVARNGPPSLPPSGLTAGIVIDVKNDELNSPCKELEIITIMDEQEFYATNTVDESAKKISKL